MDDAQSTAGVSTRSPSFTVKTTKAPSVTFTRTTTENISYTEYNTWEYSILTTGTKVEDTTSSVSINTPSNFYTEPSTPTPFVMTTQNASANVTLSIISDVIQSTALNTGTDDNFITGKDGLDFTQVTSPSAEFDESQDGSGKPSGDDELTISGWHETETVTNTSTALILTTLTFEETAALDKSIEALSFMTTSSITVPTTVTLTTSAPMTQKVTTTRPTTKEEENNAIEVPFQVSGVDNEFPESNVIPRRGRVFLRERTRNKRIQELLEEKRNFLRRIKRAQGF